jgi:hypothetical protein
MQHAAAGRLCACAATFHTPCTPFHRTFRCFLSAIDVHGAAYRSFVFSKPQETEAKQAHNLNFDEGRMRATVMQRGLNGRSRISLPHITLLMIESTTSLDLHASFDAANRITFLLPGCPAWLAELVGCRHPLAPSSLATRLPACCRCTLHSTRGRCWLQACATLGQTAPTRALPSCQRARR